MKIYRTVGWTAVILLIGLICSGSPVSEKKFRDDRVPWPETKTRAIQAEETPAGLSAGDWAAIRKQVSRHRHRITRVAGDAYGAENREQQMRATFADGGLWVEPAGGGWKWGLHLAGVGKNAVSGPPRAVRAEGERIYYHWDDFLTEWVENGERGLEHGFTIKERPPNLGTGEPLTLTMKVLGGLQAKEEPGGQGMGFHDREGRRRLTYGELLVVDARGSRVPARLEGGEETVRIAVDDRMAAYPLTIDPLIQQAYLKASNTGGLDQFGWAVAISGNTVVVGAYGEDSSATGIDGPGEDNTAPNAGAVYIFARGGVTWAQQAYLKASNAGGGDQFVWSVAIDGDTVIVGADNEDSSATGVNGNQGDDSFFGSSGAAYVFVRETGVWRQQGYLKASNTGEEDHFGYSAAVSGNTVVVGAGGEDSNAWRIDGDEGNNSASEAGAAYAFILLPDPRVNKTLSPSQKVSIGDAFTWILSVSNLYGKALFPSGKEILHDSLPSAGIVFQSVTVGNLHQVEGGEKINCSLAGTTLVCRAAEGDVVLEADDGNNDCKGSSLTVELRKVYQPLIIR